MYLPYRLDKVTHQYLCNHMDVFLLFQVFGMQSLSQTMAECNSLDLCCRPDLFALPLARVSGIHAAAYNLLAWREPWADASVGNSSFMFAESGQFVLDRYISTGRPQALKCILASVCFCATMWMVLPSSALHYCVLTAASLSLEMKIYHYFAMLC